MVAMGRWMNHPYTVSYCKKNLDDWGRLLCCKLYECNYAAMETTYWIRMGLGFAIHDIRTYIRIRKANGGEGPRGEQGST